MGNNWIDNGLVSTTGDALPGTKIDVPGAPSPPSNECLHAVEFNTVTGALTDTKTVIDRQVSIMSYGADPTGTADSSTALIAAYTALAPNGGILHLPVGTYKIAANVSVPANVALSFDTSGFSVNNGYTLTVLGNIIPPYAMPQVNAGPVTPVFVKPRDYYGTAAPVAGTYIIGDRLWLISPVAGGSMGYVCTTGGTPGTWNVFGAISA